MESLFNTEKPLFITLVGKSNKGKSHFTKYLLQYFFNACGFEFGLVFVKTKYDNDFQAFPDNRVIPGYNQDMLMKYTSNLESMKKRMGSVPKNIIVLDDLTGILNNRTQWFINWVATCRHLNTSVIITSQYLNQAISPIIREQTTHAVLFNSRTAITLKNLYEAYGGLFSDFKEWKAYFLEATKEPYVALLYRECVDTLEENYVPIRCPENINEVKIQF